MKRVIYLDPETHYLYDSDFKLISTDKKANLDLFPPIDNDHVFGGYKSGEFIVDRKYQTLLMYKSI
jgi:hypothetical protein